MRNVKLMLLAALAAVGFLLSPEPAIAQLSRLGECPQPRFTGKAPDEYYLRKSPLEAPDMQAGAQLFNGSGSDGGCTVCHGRRGDGKGPLARQYDPPPRNFACARTVNGVPDGQLVWIIRFGSPGTAMPPHPQFTDNDVWQLVAFLRTLAK